ncbi:tetratricopeptide repeat protein, partial [Paraglaciecola hydrolytica]|uniref:tetratricopeptide repeat protein n=1 Tax=Paraglaciecola hydrolytica TaxID=1799789 RepID=UPI00138ED547
MTLSPTLPVQSLAVFWQLLNQQQFAAAQQQLQQLLQQHPDFAPAWYGAAVLASRQRNNTQALHHLTKALELDDDNIQFLLFKIRLLISLGSQQAAKQLALTLAQGTYAQTEICADLALLLNSLKLHKHALDYYQQAHNLAPMDAGILFNLASLQRYMGQLTEAEANLDKAIELKPSDSEAWLLRSNLRKQTADDNHVNAIQQQIQQGSQQTAGDVLSSVQLHYALGKEYEDLQQYSACFSALNQGASLRRRNMQYNVQNDIATIDKIIEVFTPQLFTDKPAGHNSQQPIFILGLPRTGSTMVERIIG